MLVENINKETNKKSIQKWFEVVLLTLKSETQKIKTKQKQQQQQQKQAKKVIKTNLKIFFIKECVNDVKEIAHSINMYLKRSRAILKHLEILIIDL